MSIRFAIKSTVAPAIKEGNVTVRFSGTSEVTKSSEERDCTVVGVDGAGNPRFVFNTGLDVDKVDLYRWYSKEEQEEVKKQINELKPLISRANGGDTIIDPTNAFFWKRNKDVNVLSLNSQDLNKFYDTKFVTHALLYLSIISGAFMGMVAPTKEWAENQKIPLYLVLETDDIEEDDTEITKSDAHAALGELKKDENTDALFILAWCIQSDNEKYGAYTKSISKRDLVSYHIQFIEGKLQTKKKRNCPRVFLDYYNKWKKQQTRPLLYTEAYAKAGDYYGFISRRDKVYTTTEGTELGTSMSEVIENLQKTKFSRDLEFLRDQVEAKWKE